MVSEKKLQDIADILRRDCLVMTSEAGSGHPTSCLSCAEIMAVLFFNEIRYNQRDAFDPDGDEFILSKGHAAPILYSALYRAGLSIHHPNSLRKLKSPLEGHPVPSSHVPSIKVATGSLGQGLSVGVGMALSGKLQKRKFRTYVLLGDSETSEGSVYEALELGSHYNLNNLIAIIDVNRLGQTGETMLGHDIKKYENRFEGFGWKVISIDGHDISQIMNAFNSSKKSDKPVVILAKTLKGKGVSFLENKNGWHGRALDREQLLMALKEIPNPEMPKIRIKKSRIKKIGRKFVRQDFTRYEIGEEVATRDAYGNALANIARKDKTFVALDGEVSNSTKSEKVKEKSRKQFIEAYIAEQNMVGMALGLSKKGHNVFASTFSAFLSRADDHLRMTSLSLPNLTFCGSHSGVSIGEDGVSQMGLSDISFFRTLPFSFIFYPSDAVSAEKLVDLAYRTAGLKYIRTTRPKTPVLYRNNETFPLGDFKVLRQSDSDKLVLAGSGITVHEALKAHEKLKERGMKTAVVDLYCVRPFNVKKFIEFVKKHGNKVIVSEDHYPEGGIGEMLVSNLYNSGIKIKTLAVNNIPHSGTKEELLEKYGINDRHIISAAEEI
jgi:transketolase